MFNELAKIVGDLLKEDPKEKDRTQEQLKRVLDERFTPSLELWRDLWQFGDKYSTSDPDTKAIDQLSQKVDSFVHKCGGLVSLECLVDLERFRQTLREIATSEASMNPDLLKDSSIRALKAQLLPWTTKDGQPLPGLLLRLRDQLGSNSRALSSVLK